MNQEIMRLQGGKEREWSTIFEVNGGNVGPIIGINRFEAREIALEAQH
jgi:hypothetical protein